MEIAEFLLARIAEDEAVALEADGHESRTYWSEAVASRALRRHYEWHDPARVLAECDAKRRIVEMVVAADDPVGTFDPDYWAGLGIAEAALQLLALPYADHPDYREEWRP